jgi:hypothetical protein
VIDFGVTVVKGEVEETWGELLADALQDRLKRIYDFMDRKPDLFDKPVPTIHRSYLKHFITSNFGTIDCSRGCPYNCSFCTIINVQGRMMRAGEHMDPDLNRYDSFHETTRHPNFAPGELYATCRKAWLSFYSFEHMRHVLANAYPGNYWNILRNFIWYKNSVQIEGGHPMLHGLFRLKDRTDRRPGFPIESRPTHFARRFRDVCGLVGKWTALLLEMEDLWLQTRIRSKAEVRLVSELKRAREEVRRNLRTAELQLAHYRAKVHVPELHVPSKLALAFRDLNFGLAKHITYSRADIQRFWAETWRKWRRKKIFHIPLHKIILHFLREAQLFLLFAAALLRAQADSRENTARL